MKRNKAEKCVSALRLGRSAISNKVGGGSLRLELFYHYFVTCVAQQQERGAFDAIVQRVKLDRECLQPIVGVA